MDEGVRNLQPFGFMMKETFVGDPPQLPISYRERLKGAWWEIASRGDQGSFGVDEPKHSKSTVRWRSLLRKPSYA